MNWHKLHVKNMNVTATNANPISNNIGVIKSFVVGVSTNILVEIKYRTMIITLILSLLFREVDGTTTTKPGSQASKHLAYWRFTAVCGRHEPLNN